MKVCKKDLRISRDWLGDRWIDIKAKPDITSTISTVDSFNRKLSVSPIAKDVDSVGFANSCDDVPDGNKSNEPNIVEEKLVCCEGFAEDVNWVNDNKPPSQKCTQVDNIETDGGSDNESNGDDDDKDNKDGDCNQDVNNDDGDMEVLGTSEKDCKAAEPMEVAA